VIVRKTFISGKLATTLEAAELELGLALGHGLPLQRWIAAASDLIVQLIGRELAAAEYVESLPGSGGTELLLEGRPLISVLGVTYQGAPITDYIISGANPSIIYRSAGWPEARFITSWLTENVVATQTQDYEVTYRAGYYMANEAIPDLPSRFEQACLLLIRQFYLQQGRDGSITSERVGDLAVTYSEKGRVVTPEVYELLGVEVPG
jgi:hypothetical protein